MELIERMKPGCFQQRLEDGSYDPSPGLIGAFLLLRGGDRKNSRGFGWTKAAVEALPDLRRLNGRWYQLSTPTGRNRPDGKVEREFLGGALRFEPEIRAENLQKLLQRAALSDDALFDPRDHMAWGDHLVAEGKLDKADFGALGGSPEHVLFLPPSTPDPMALTVWWADRMSSNEEVGDDHPQLF